jgi:hypothetical protein
MSEQYESVRIQTNSSGFMNKTAYNMEDKTVHVPSPSLNPLLANKSIITSQSEGFGPPDPG